MIIDCHTHLEFGVEPLVTARELIMSMDKAKIDKSLVYAGKMFNCSNEKLLEEIVPFKERLIPIGSVSPLSENESSLQKIENLLSSGAISGLKFYTGYEHFYPTDEILKPYLVLLEKYNRPAIFHSGDTYNQAGDAKLKFAQPLNFDDLAVDMPNLKIVVAHFGYPWVIDATAVVYKNKNVYTDCSGLVYGTPQKKDVILLKKLFDDYLLFGGSMDKLLFGTDWNLSGQKEYLKYIDGLKLDRASKEKVYYKNCIELFRL